MKSTIRNSIIRGSVIVSFTMVLFAAYGFIQKTEDIYFNINRGIDLFGRIYKEIAVNYVDDLDPTSMMNAGIRGMLSSLDPYTVFIGEENKSDVEMLTTGKYGGIGITVGVRDGKITITSIMEGYSAEREGLRIGDFILEIDGHPVIQKRTDEVRTLMRGDAGTIVKLKIERPGKEKTFELSLKREEIQLKNVTYADTIDQGIAYIKLDRFTRRAGEDIRDALKQFQSNSSLDGIILDIRDNPGGLLDAAVDVMEKFVPKGSLIVSTRGRKPNSTREYRSEEDPINPTVPLIVLVNNSSASASEIVAGAVQDLDRGVLVGVRTFGKGLVQTVTPLSYNTSLKITTARYYTPSGRCIQEIDYSKNDSLGGEKKNDSPKAIFKTLTIGRTVLEAGGIAPDTIIQKTPQPKFVDELLKKGILFDFISEVANASTVSRPVVNADLLTQLKAFIEKMKFEFKDDALTKCDELLTIASREQFSDKSVSSLKNLQNEIRTAHRNDFEKYSESIKQILTTELIGRYEGSKAKIKSSLDNDNQVQAAVTIIKNKSLYQRLLNKPH